MHACITFHQIRDVQMCHSYCILGCAQDFLCDHIIMYLFNNLPFSVLILCISHFLTSLFNLLSLLIRSVSVLFLSPYLVQIFTMANHWNKVNGMISSSLNWTLLQTSRKSYVTFSYSSKKCCSSCVHPFSLFRLFSID